jgi:hypothetical protein
VSHYYTHIMTIAQAQVHNWFRNLDLFLQDPRRAARGKSPMAPSRVLGKRAPGSDDAPPFEQHASQRPRPDATTMESVATSHTRPLTTSCSDVSTAIPQVSFLATLSDVLVLFAARYVLDCA